MEAADIVKEALGFAGRSVLATIVHVEGHAYRKTGAMMLLKEGGGANGSLSPGCLESDLREYVPAVLRQAAPQIVEYDMRSPDDLSWGEGIGCGGLVRILLEPVAGALAEALAQADKLLEQGIGAILRRTPGDGLLPDGYAVEAAEDDASTHRLSAVVDAAGRRLADGLAEVGRLDGEMAARLTPKPRLVLFGAGDDAVPVSLLAQRAGFRVTVADFRQGLCRAERFPGAALVYGFPAELAQSLALTARDYVIVMSHHFKRDSEFLELAAQAGPCYLGVMGSVSRTERMLGGRAAPAGLRYPVGLPIGADGPEEIALSIAAELISVRRGREKHGEAVRGGVVFGRGKRQPDGTQQAFDPARRER